MHFVCEHLSLVCEHLPLTRDFCVNVNPRALHDARNVGSALARSDNA